MSTTFSVHRCFRKYTTLLDAVDDLVSQSNNTNQEVLRNKELNKERETELVSKSEMKTQTAP